MLIAGIEAMPKQNSCFLLQSFQFCRLWAADFEFVDGHQSHLGHTATKGPENKEDENEPSNANIHKKGAVIWTESGRAELTKVPFFVRGKVKSNTEKYALSKGLPEISDETLYDAKAYFSQFLQINNYLNMSILTHNLID